MKNLKIFTDNIEEEAVKQIELLLKQESFKKCKIRIMPDCHKGTGCVIGFTSNLGDKVIPNIVGVDIGCGVLCVKLGKRELDLDKLDKIIRDNIPSGRDVNETIREKGFSAYTANVHNKLKEMKCYDKLQRIDWLENSLGTLGGGNHFIEIDVDEEGNKYLLIHTGSRNVGFQVCTIYQNIAVDYCSFEKRMKAEQAQLVKECKQNGKEHLIYRGIEEIKKRYEGKKQIPKDLCYIEGKDLDNYLHDMKICQAFANENRLDIAQTILCNLFDDVSFEEGNESLEYFQCIHNYINFEDNIIRKGSISAHKGEKLLIPLNMRDGVILGVGKGNEDWNYSAPHGAGRIMSRMEAKKKLKLQDYKASMSGIYTSCVSEDTIDEAPMVYKPMDEIVENIKDNVEIERIIKPIYNFKASE